MSCCTPKNEPTSVEPLLCPVCETKGQKVKPLTLRSLLKSSLSGEINEEENYRFCKNFQCDVAYYGSIQGQRYNKSQVSVPIYQKEESESTPICYCFDFSRGDVLSEIQKSGKSRIYEEIKRRKKDEGCDCDTLNPQGSCCLGNVKALIKKGHSITA